MQRKRIIVIGFVVVILVMAVVFFKKEPSQTPVQQKTVSESQPKKESAPPSHITQRLTHETPLNLGNKGGVKNNTSKLWRQAVKMAKEHASKIYSYRSSKNKAFDFYGKVVDQNMQPVVGAAIVLDVVYFDGALTPAFFPRDYPVRMVTDARGMFSLTNQNAMRLIFESIEKAGYKISKYEERQTFDFSRDNPTPNNGPDNPVVFKAWKSNTHQAILSGSIKPRLIPDGRTYTVDFLKDKVIAQEGALDGDLHIAFFREGTTWANGMSWKVDMEIVRGGIMETSDRYTYIAPESGYNNTWSYEIHRTKYRLPDKETKFYFRSRDGDVYGMLNIRFKPFHSTDKSRIYIEYSVNPDGSRILE